MKNILDEFRDRWRVVEYMSDLSQANARFRAFWEWLEANRETKEIVEKIMAAAPLSSLVDQTNANAVPKAGSLEEIASLGLHLMKKIAGGEDCYSVLANIGILGSRTFYEDFSTGMSAYFQPAAEYVERRLQEANPPDQTVSILAGGRVTDASFPLEITDSLRNFLRDHPDLKRNAFIMMRFGETSAHVGIVESIKHTLIKYGVTGFRADDKSYHDDLFPNVLTYIYGCSFGIAVFERLEEERFNPNVALEVGYMRAIRKPVCLLKDKTLKTLQTDLVGKLYKEFDPQTPKETIPVVLEKWLRDKDIIT